MPSLQEPCRKKEGDPLLSTVKGDISVWTTGVENGEKT